MMSLDLNGDQLREKGNECFKQGNYDAAIEFYTQALSVCPSSHLAYSNRSLVYSKTGRFVQALEDAEKCLQLAPGFAKAYQRKATALNGLKRHEEALTAAESGYRLRSSDVISKGCVLEWVAANQAVMLPKVDAFEKEASVALNVPEYLLVVSERYLNIYLNIAFTRMRHSTTGVKVGLVKACARQLLDEMNRLLTVFGHNPLPIAEEWLEALGLACRVNPLTSRVPQSSVDGLMKRTEHFAEWLDNNVDHVLHRIVGSVVSLLLIAVGIYYVSLNMRNVEHHVTQTLCHALLIFFRKPPLSSPVYIEQHISVYKEMLESYATDAVPFTVVTTDFVVKSVKTLQELLEKCDSNLVSDFAMEAAAKSIEIVQARLGQCSDTSDSTTESADKLKKHVIEQLERLKPAIGETSESTINCVEELLCYTEYLIQTGEHSMPSDIFQLAESIFCNVLQQQIAARNLTLENAPSALLKYQTVILVNAFHLLGVQDVLLADLVIRWKCIYSEFQALAIQLGAGEHYREKFYTVEQGRLAAPEASSASISLGSDLSKKSEVFLETTGCKIFAGLFRQSVWDIQKLLKPDQLILEYCLNPSLYGSLNVKPEDLPPTSNAVGVLLVIRSTGSPVAKSIDFAKASELAADWSKALAKTADQPFSESQLQESDTIGRKLCELLIPPDVEAIIGSDAVHRVYLCSHLAFTYILPMKMLPFGDGKRLADKCCLVHLSSSRELLRQNTLLVCEEQSDTPMQLSDASADDDSVTVRSKMQRQLVVLANPNYNLEKLSPDMGMMERIGWALSGILSPPESEIEALPDTMQEAMDIEHTFFTRAPSVKMGRLVGDDATISSVMALESPFVLHLSTHGFTKLEEKIVLSGSLGGLKYGVLLAGANTFRKGRLHAVAKEAGTGELNALGVFGMHLQGTRLVYLSTCVSSIGLYAPGESMNSLAHAFRSAGAQTVVGTPWKVLDNHAREFAHYFYCAVCQPGIAPSQALAAAERELKSQHPHWAAWGGFMCTGEDIPLFPL